MEIIKPEPENYEKLAERVFLKAIEIAGGLKKLVEYRNLTWLPSLAEAAFVVVLKNKAALTNREIAEKVGITEQTVVNILKADTEKLEEWLRGEAEKIDEHKAGALAKLAYEKIETEGASM